MAVSAMFSAAEPRANVAFRRTGMCPAALASSRGLTDPPLHGDNGLRRHGWGRCSMQDRTRRPAGQHRRCGDVDLPSPAQKRSAAMTSSCFLLPRRSRSARAKWSVHIGELMADRAKTLAPAMRLAQTTRAKQGNGMTIRSLGDRCTRALCDVKRVAYNAARLPQDSSG